MPSAGVYGPTPERLALAAQAAKLRRDGLLIREIQERLGVSYTYASDLVNDPDGAKARTRKDTYRGRCSDCGAPTSGSDGPNATPERCETCSRAFKSANRVWTRAAVVDAMHRFAAEHGRPPTMTDWRHADPGRGYPCAGSVYGRTRGWAAPFASWAEAIEAAGFPRPRRGQRLGETWRSREQIIQEIRALAVNGAAPSSYSHLALSRSAAVYFGSWRAAVKAAGLRPYQRPVQPCGTAAAYQRGCRCDDCRHAMAAKQRAYRLKVAA